ncbi:hypothetical protein DPMN_099033 [Dreissena polymorpha]|uniref:Uncharacterized protein n=1 Tax=Dreissena polymorpha TaxID=45954 RepID=A0A9D4LDB2_DREPO|nr:hypothetical protein DPMN_099033 [Dreissena polymorpha]
MTILTPSLKWQLWRRDSLHLCLWPGQSSSSNNKNNKYRSSAGPVKAAAAIRIRAKITSSIRDTFLGCPKVFLSVHRGLILTSSSPVSDVHIMKLCISIETRIEKLWFVFEAFEPATVIIGHMNQQQSSSQHSGISKVQDPCRTNYRYTPKSGASDSGGAFAAPGRAPLVCGPSGSTRNGPHAWTRSKRCFLPDMTDSPVFTLSKLHSRTAIRRLRLQRLDVEQCEKSFETLYE